MTFDGSELSSAVGPNDHVRGAKDGAVKLVEYGDYECPYCGKAHANLREALRGMDNVTFVFRNFPLMNIHPYAEQAAEAAEAAAIQGKFWEMHDVLFDNQQQLDGDSLVAYAEQIGLDVQKFVDDVNEGKTRARIKADLESGMDCGVHGTPSFFINGRRYQGGYSPAELREVLSRA